MTPTRNQLQLAILRAQDAANRADWDRLVAELTRARELAVQQRQKDRREK